MRKLMTTIAMAALMAGIATTAHAKEGWYGRGDVGYSVDGHVTLNDVDFDMNDDWMGDIGVGYDFGNGFRAEGELAYRQNDLDVPATVDTSATSLMLNVLYDFNRSGRVKPYVGAGVGYAKVDVATDDDTNWAWQAMAGVGFDVNDRTTIDVGYRFFRAQDVELLGDSNAEYEHQAVTVGVRYQFAAPPPPPPAYVPPPQSPPMQPPPPPPPACPTSEFVVYFEWDRSNLNQAAQQVIQEAVTRAQACNTSAVVAVGHTDTSGSAAYNARLSERRANVVRDALVARGVAASMITTEARGEGDLARPTRNGVREPLNRRTAVTITFH